MDSALTAPELSVKAHISGVNYHTPENRGKVLTESAIKLSDI